MKIEDNLRALRICSIAVTGFAILFLVAGLAEIALGGLAVKAEYDRIAQIEALARQATPYGSYYHEVQSQYNESSSAYLGEGRFLPAFDSLAWDSPAVLAGIALIIAGMGLLAAALMWIWRAQTNIIELGFPAKYRPAMAVAGFVIPVANLVLPFEMMRELHNRSNAEPEELAHAPVDDVTAWWTAVVVGLLVFSAMIFKFMFDVGTNLVIMTPLWMEFAIAAFAVLLLLVSAVLFSGLARSITRAQIENLPQVDPAAYRETVDRRPSVVLR